MRKFTKIAASAVFAIALLGTAVAPANAATAAPNSTSKTAHCTVANEICTVTLPSFAGGFVAFSTNFPGYTGSVTYEIVKGTAGADLCSGSMGWVATKSCTTSYTGEISFRVGTETATGSISISG